MNDDLPDHLPPTRRPLTIHLPASALAAVAAWLGSLALMIVGSVDMLDWVRSWGLWLAILATGLTVSAIVAHHLWTAGQALKIGIGLGKSQAVELLAAGKTVPLHPRSGTDSAPV